MLQQGKEEEAEEFVGNNTRQRDRKSMVAGMLQEHLQKIANITLERTPSQATELLEAEPQNSEKEKTQDHMKEELTVSQIEEIRGKRYQTMPEVEVRMVRDEEIPLGTMKEILVHASMVHEGVGLIMPILGRDIRCMYLRAISLMTEKPVQETGEAL